jgi:hypothetical protein
MSTVVVVKQRDKVYSCMIKDEHARPGIRKLVPAEKPGHEIEKEVRVCAKCASDPSVTISTSKRGNRIRTKLA